MSESFGGAAVSADYIVVLEKWTRTSGQRKIGDGPWEEIDLTPFGGRVPVVFLNDAAEWVCTETWREVAR